MKSSAMARFGTIAYLQTKLPLGKLAVLKEWVSTQEIVILQFNGGTKPPY